MWPGSRDIMGIRHISNSKRLQSTHVLVPNKQWSLAYSTHTGWMGSPEKNTVPIYHTDATHTHTRLMALFPGLPGWAGTRKVEPIWILLKQETVSGSGINWAICKSACRSRQIATPVPHHSVFYRAMLCIRGTSHGPVSVCVCVCLSVCLSVTSQCSTKTA